MWLLIYFRVAVFLYIYADKTVNILCRISQGLLVICDLFVIKSYVTISMT